MILRDTALLLGGGLMLAFPCPTQLPERFPASFLGWALETFLLSLSRGCDTQHCDGSGRILARATSN
jgi:hypothetical protein